ncbi:DHH family phosphoesterase [Patescibacteria group bacterium]|nr:DHH family phosphoesterase [Patescibacteria group bacterium]
MDKGKILKDSIEKSSKILIASHTRPTVDSISSMLLAWHFLSVGFKKKIDIYIPKLPDRLEYLLKYSMLTIDNIQKSSPQNIYQFKIPKDNGKIKFIKYTDDKDNYIFHINMESGFIDNKTLDLSKETFPYDLLFTIDTIDLKYLGEIYKTYKSDILSSNINIINIDTHSNNQNYGDINITSINFNSTAQIIFRIFSELVSLVSQKEYHLLLLAILANTMSLHSNNITQETFNDIQSILSENINIENANMELSAPSNINDLKTKSTILNNAKIVQIKKFSFILSTIDTGNIKDSYLNDIYVNEAIATCIIVNSKDGYKVYIKPFTYTLQENKIQKLDSQYKYENGVYMFKSNNKLETTIDNINSLF